MPVNKKTVKATSKKTAPLKASVKTKTKKGSLGHSVHIIERDFIIITSGGFLVIVMVIFLLFS